MVAFFNAETVKKRDSVHLTGNTLFPTFHNCISYYFVNLWKGFKVTNILKWLLWSFAVPVTQVSTSNLVKNIILNFLAWNWKLLQNLKIDLILTYSISILILSGKLRISSFDQLVVPTQVNGHMKFEMSRMCNFYSFSYIFQKHFDSIVF